MNIKNFLLVVALAGSLSVSAQEQSSSKQQIAQVVSTAFFTFQASSIISSALLSDRRNWQLTVSNAIMKLTSAGIAYHIVQRIFKSKKSNDAEVQPAI